MGPKIHHKKNNNKKKNKKQQKRLPHTPRPFTRRKPHHFLPAVSTPTSRNVQEVFLERKFASEKASSRFLSGPPHNGTRREGSSSRISATLQLITRTAHQITKYTEKQGPRTLHRGRPNSSPTHFCGPGPGDNGASRIHLTTDTGTHHHHRPGGCFIFISARRRRCRVRCRFFVRGRTEKSRARHIHSYPPATTPRPSRRFIFRALSSSRQAARPLPLSGR